MAYARAYARGTREERGEQSRQELRLVHGQSDYPGVNEARGSFRLATYKH